jgi:hypothetical protein
MEAGREDWGRQRGWRQGGRMETGLGDRGRTVGWRQAESLRQAGRMEAGREDRGRMGGWRQAESMKQAVRIEADMEEEGSTGGWRQGGRMEAGRREWRQDVEWGLIRWDCLLGIQLCQNVGLLQYYMSLAKIQGNAKMCKKFRSLRKICTTHHPHISPPPSSSHIWASVSSVW